MKDIYIIDGMALAYRGHYAFIRNPLKNSNGFPTSAIYSFLVTIRHFLDIEKAEEIVVVFDAGRETFRREIYAEYKAHRPPLPDEIRQQLPKINELLSALKIPVVSITGFEADDIIGTIAVKRAAMGDKVYIVSKDKDFGQLVNENITLVDPKIQAGEIIKLGPSEINAKFGVGPDQIIDYLALLGDASDNVPGVPKVGEKTAVELIREFGSLDRLYENIESVKRDGLRKTLVENRELAYLSRTLVTIKCDIELDSFGFMAGPEDNSAYLALLRELEFSQFVNSAVKKCATDDVPSSVNYSTLNNRESLELFINSIKEADAISIDTETDGLDPLVAPLVGISISVINGSAVYIPIAHSSGENCPIETVRAALSAILNSETVVKVGHNLKFDIAVLTAHGFKLIPPFFDTYIASYLIKPGYRRLGLDDCVLDRFGITMQQITALIGEKKGSQRFFSEVPIADATQYSCADADMALRLMRELSRELKETGMDKLFSEIEMPLLCVLIDMERNGIKIDTRFLETLSADYDAKLAAIQIDIFRAAQREFNINSPKQLQEVLFNDLKIKPLKKNKTGFSTDSEVLEELARDYEVPKLIMAHRKFQKLKSTYIDALPLWADDRGKVHTSFNQAVTATGRLSSSEPNLQNIPIRSDEGKEIRKAFIPSEEGRVLISADYSQIELRILAHIANEEVLIEAFCEDEDIHRKTASLVFGIMPELITIEQRAMAKTVNFGIVYGQGAFGLSQQLGISRAEAQRFIDNYLATYPAVRRYMDKTIESARERGFVETMFGRRRPLPDIMSKNRQEAAFAERMAINTPIQGTAADLIKIAMVKIAKKITDGLMKGVLLIQVHDELVLECDKQDSDSVVSEVRFEMENAVQLKVPLKVDIGKGSNWLEAH